MEIGNFLFGHGHGPVALDRSELQQTFCDMLEDAGVDIYGYAQTFNPEDHNLVAEGWPKTAWQVDEFIIMPHHWDDTQGADRPNFTDTKTDTKIWWYKYALRDPSANKALHLDDIVEMMERLKEATRKLGSTRYE
jgi:hypothetical protein